jgi:hypothetical protein
MLLQNLDGYKFSKLKREKEKTQQSKGTFFLGGGNCGLDSGSFTCKAGIQLIEPQLQFILLLLFRRWGGGGLKNYLPGLASNCDPPM